jgi:hexosaminidase
MIAIMNGINKLIMVSVLLLSSLSMSAQFNIIPLPESINENGDTFTITNQTKIYYEKGLKQQAKLLSAALSPATGFDFEISDGKKTLKNVILLKLAAKKSANKESYKLSVKNDQIIIEGNTAAGVFYGTQTLLQMLPAGIYNKERQKTVAWKIKGATIEDAPLYPWRGMMLDVARYFFEKEYVLRFIDMMAMYKMNTLHLHLVDDAGWRIEIKKYPKLTSVGAWRGEGENRVGGYYTQEDIKEMVAYAAARNVDIIPEIELPAHALASIAAYPYLSCTGEQYTVQTQHSISLEIYCVGKESTFSFLQDVFAETFTLFPSKYIHIGGDEAVYDRWKACPHCQKRKADLGLKTEKELQVYFNRRVQKMVRKYGKTIVGWDEIIEDGLEEKAVGMIWHDQQKAFKASQGGHYSVMSLTGYCYFDVAESSIPGEMKAATWLPPISLEKVYQLNPMLKGLDEKYRPQILGASATLWSDQFIHGTILQELPLINENRSEKYFDYLTFPRLSALAEVCWTPLEKQNWTSFEKRMSSHYKRYDNAGFGYRVPQPKLISKEKNGTLYELKLENVVDGAQIRYTTDGTYPNVFSTVYTQPVQVEKLTDFRAITVVNRSVYSLPFYFPEKYEKFQKHGQFIAEWKPSAIKGKDYSTFEMNGSGKIAANGEYLLSFWYTDGDSHLDIKAIEVYKNGVKITEDIHDGYTGKEQKNNSYKFKINNYETGAGFTIKAIVRGEVSNDSNGAVFIRKL